MKIKEEYKGQTITINDGILGMIKIDLNTIKPMQERRLIALGYTHLFEDEKVESHDDLIELHEDKTEEILENIKSVGKILDEMTEAPIEKAPVKKTRRKKSVQ
jgi:hypothetical protein